MTLALYGKSRRRQGLLVVLALFAVFVAVIAGTAVQRTDRVSAAPVAIGSIPQPVVEIKEQAAPSPVDLRPALEQTLAEAKGLVASLKAAANPSRKGYLYYVRKANDDSGEHAFSTTYEQFQRDLDRYNASRDGG